MSYGQRLLKLVKDSLVSTVCDKAKEDLAKTQLISQIENLNIHCSLILCRKNYIFNQSLSKAITLTKIIKVHSLFDSSNKYSYSSLFVFYQVNIYNIE